MIATKTEILSTFYGTNGTKISKRTCQIHMNVTLQYAQGVFFYLDYT